MRRWMTALSGLAFIMVSLAGHGPALAVALAHLTGIHSAVVMGPPIEG